jgi:AraC-like DNA-binding protein
VSHPVFSYDDCLVIELTTTCFRDVLETVRPPEIPFTGAHSLLAPSAMASRNLLWHRLAHRIAGPLEVEETGVHVLSHILRYSREIRGFVRGSRIPGQIEMAKAVLLSHPERNWSLASLARAVECSPFHLTRMFREHVGVPLHRYQLHTRLAAAMDFLLETDRDLTTIALDLGFSSHSHFTASFKRLTGFTPGHMREAANSRIAAETRKILIAPLF